MGPKKGTCIRASTTSNALRRMKTEMAIQERSRQCTPDACLSLHVPLPAIHNATASRMKPGESSKLSNPVVVASPGGNHPTTCIVVRNIELTVLLSHVSTTKK